MSDSPNVETKKENGKSFLRFTGLIAAAAGLLVVLFLFVLPVLSISTKIDGVKSQTTLTLGQVFAGNYPMNVTWVMLLVFLGAGIILSVLSFCFAKSPKVVDSISSVASILYLLVVCFLVVGAPLFTNNVENLGVEIEGFRSVDIVNGSIFGIVFGLIAAMLSLVVPFQKKNFSAKEIAEDGMLIALAFILNLVKIPVAEQGGSINFQMLPLFIIALRHGPASGLVCGGLIYGVLTCLTDGYGFACFPFDYLIGFGSVAVVGLFRKQILGDGVKGYGWESIVFIVIAGILSTFVRFVGSSVSSMVIYGADFVFAMTYNAIYIPVSGAIAIAALIGLHGPLVKINKLFPVVA